MLIPAVNAVRISPVPERRGEAGSASALVGRQSVARKCGRPQQFAAVAAKWKGDSHVKMVVGRSAVPALGTA
jgi:hypothetical protein